MVKVIQDIWVQKDNGIVLFSRVYDQTVEDQLFGALMSALNSFAEEITKDSLSNFELSKKRFTLLRKGDLLFVGTTDKKSKEKKVISELQMVSEKFIKLYPEAMSKDWDGEISIFSDFEKEIDSSLENPIKKFWSDF